MRIRHQEELTELHKKRGEVSVFIVPARPTSSPNLPLENYTVGFRADPKLAQLTQLIEVLGSS